MMNLASGNGSGDNNAPQPIIIVRRRRIEDDGHHGGAWKIAFADFMTAMMALFLVLWLVNASDDESRKAVASYFNPVKLVDREPSRKGLAAPEDGSDSKTEERREGANSGEGIEKDFDADPDALMDERSARARVSQSGPGADEGALSLDAPQRSDDPFALGKPNIPTAEAVDDAEPAAADVPTAPEPTAGESSTKSLADDLREALNDALPDLTAPDDLLSVEEVPEGTLITLAEGANFAMFDTGSYVPTGRAVLALEAFGPVLAERSGAVRVHGHTDAVPFRSDGPVAERDNWKLSADRALTARLMLLRGGLDSARIARVTGFAASRPLANSDPMDARNRRIEILLERS